MEREIVITKSKIIAYLEPNIQITVREDESSYDIYIFREYNYWNPFNWGREAKQHHISLPKIVTPKED